MSTPEKYIRLQEYLCDLGSVAVAFSRGVDSTFLLRVAHDVLGDRIIAVTADSCSFPKRELQEAEKFCRRNGIRHIVCQSEELDIEGFRQNPKNRGYLCKHELFEKIWAIAREHGLAAVAEGSNMDDNGDHRPGLIAIRELGVKSPLQEAGLSKAEIRELSHQLGCQSGINSPLPVCPPGLFMAKPSARENWRWWIARSSCCWIWDSIRFASAFTARLPELRSCRGI